MERTAVMGAIALAWCAFSRPVAASGPEPLYWEGGPVVVVNATPRARLYVVVDTADHHELTRIFRLRSGGVCRLDTGLYLSPPDTADGPAHFRASSRDPLLGLAQGDAVEDVSDGYLGVFNGPALRYPRSSCTACNNPESDIQELMACSALGDHRCAGQFWSSWQVGVLAPERQTLDYACGLWMFARTCTMEFVPNHLYGPATDWGQLEGSGPSDAALRVRGSWPKALLLIQGAVGGQRFDPHRLDAMRSVDAFEAPLCSSIAPVPVSAPPGAG